MIAAANFAWVVLCAAAVWAGTRQRFGTADELRTFAAVIAALVISAGLSTLGALPAETGADFNTPPPVSLI